MAVAPTNQEQRILEVARSLFTQRGFANIAVRDICCAANVTPPTLYYYFKNKEALFDAVVRETITMTEFINKLLYEPTARLKDHMGNGDGEDYEAMIRELFAIGRENEQ